MNWIKRSIYETKMENRERTDQIHVLIPFTESSSLLDNARHRHGDIMNECQATVNLRGSHLFWLYQLEAHVGASNRKQLLAIKQPALEENVQCPYLILLHFADEGNKTGEGGERNVIISIFGEFSPVRKKKLKRKEDGQGFISSFPDESVPHTWACWLSLGPDPLWSWSAGTHPGRWRHQGGSEQFGREDRCVSGAQATLFPL